MIDFLTNMDNIRTFAIVLSAFFAGCSVIWSAWVYRRNERNKGYTELRNSLLEYNKCLHSIDSLLSVRHSVECSEAIFNEFSNITDLTKSPNELEIFFTKETNISCIKRSLILSIRNIESVDKLRNQVILTESLSHTFRETLPVLCKALKHLSTMTKIIASIHASMEFYSDQLTDKNFWSSARVELSEICIQNGPATAFKILLTEMSAHSLYGVQPAIDASCDMSDLILDQYLAMSDKQFKKQSEIENKLAPELEDIDYTSSVDDAVACISLLRNNSLSNCWPAVKEASKKLVEAYHKIGED